LPEAEEFPRMGELRDKVGSPKLALRLFVQKGGAQAVKDAAENRRRDLLVYVALANLRKRVPFGHLSLSLRADIRTFFRSYTRALEKGIELLYAAGDSGEIQLACEELKLGWQDEQALYLHRSLLGELPPVLRAYVGCATTLFGDVSQADVIKVHKASGKATFLVYDDFECKLLPELLQFFRELLKICRDNVILNPFKTLEPERGNLVEHRALVRNWVGKDDVKSRNAIRDDKEQRLPEIENFAHLAAAQYFDSRQVD